MEARLLISCPDRPGIVAAVAGFLHARGLNVVSSAQHSTDPSGGTFFMRMAFTAPDDPGDADLAGLAAAFAEAVAAPLDMQWRLSAARCPRIAVLVSREDHCLLDLLWRARREELGGEVVAVLSNHPDCAGDAEAFGVPYHHVPITSATKPEAEARQLELLAAAEPDLVVLARYMQILSGAFLERVGVPVINIHHSFLPAFAGADPYRRALERGVKVIGATAHYVTEELDAGPIIEQDVARVTHADSVAALTRRGRDVERTVLARAVRAHLEDRVLVHLGRTVVF